MGTITTRTNRKSLPQSEIRSTWESPAFQKGLIELQLAREPETLWQALLNCSKAQLPSHHDILFASQMLGRTPVFGRTASGVVRGTGYWGRLAQIAGATDVMIKLPDLRVARMSDHFDLSREQDRLMHEEFMLPEGWRFCLNAFFRDENGLPLGTLAINRTEAQGDFSDAEVRHLMDAQPILEAGVRRVCADQTAVARRMALENCLFTLPVPFLVVDWDVGILFANLAGRNSLRLWCRESLFLKPFHSETALPTDLLACVQSLRDSWKMAVESDASDAQQMRMEVTHSEIVGLRAALRIIPPMKGELLRPGVVVQFTVPRALDAGAAAAMASLALLTRMEREVAALAAGGADNQSIASQLGISLHTVRAHLRAIFRKLGIATRAKLAPMHAVLVSDLSIND